MSTLEPAPIPAPASPPAGAPIPWHRRLEARVVLGVSLAVGISIVALLVATARVVRTNSLAQAADNLQATRAAFYELVDSRAAFTAAQLRLITELPVFRAHLTDVRLAGDAATIHEMADGYRRELNADFIIVTDVGGTWIGSPEWPSGAAMPPDMRAGIEAARTGSSRKAIVSIENRLYLVVAEPARFASEVLGTVSVGYILDDAVARELARTTRCEVNLISGGRVSGSSLPSSQRDSLSTLVAAGADSLGRVGQSAVLRPLGDAEYVSGTYPLQAGASTAGAGTLVLLQDWQPTEHFIDEIRTSVVWLGGLTFLFALAGGLILSRRMTRPVREIAIVAQEIAAGHWDRRAPIRGRDEAAAMATAFNEMAVTLTHWHGEARQREVELRQSQKMDAIGQLAGGVAHDFNNLLMAIHGYTELLLMDMPAEDERREDLQQILKAADSAGALTRQLLVFSRKQILTMKVLNLGEIVGGMEKMLRRLIGEDIELIVRAPDQLWRIKADAGQLEQVIMNLAVNARDAMPQGGRLSVVLANVASDASVAMTVSDSGSGMDAETLLRIFEPFYTTKEPGRGTGLGLAMVYGIVKQSGGSISVESVPGKGTSFRLLFPRDEQDASVDEPEALADLLHDQASGTVLLVEDEQAVRDFVRKVLEREGYLTLEASRGDDALAVASRTAGPIDLLLTDVVMPGMSGHVLWKQLSALRPDMKVLFMSGYTDDAVLRHGVRDSGLPYLQKPFTFAELAREIRQILGRERFVAPGAGRT